MNIFRSILILSTIGAASSTMADVCAPRDAVVAKLASGFGEQPVATGMTDDGGQLEVWMSPKTGTFTVLVSRPDGSTCIVSSGGDFWAEPAGVRL